MLFLLIAGVSANDINTTDEIISTDNFDENIDVESSVNPELIGEDSDENSDDEKLKYSQEDTLSDEGEFIDVSDAYVYLNQFRNESGVWQWNEDNTTKTVFNTDASNQLQPLSRDLSLEETAKIRAKEIATKYAHERPDGTKCFTAFPQGLMAMGENIAYGQSSSFEVTEVWKETNDPYSGQGHRRNMLNSNFNSVGIAGYKVNGVIYWVQDFGYVNSNGGKIINTNTAGNSNSKSTTKAPVKKATKITAKKITFKAKSKTKKYTITLKSGKNAVKNLIVYLKIGKKTFEATTNKYGKATFKIKLTKRGTYSSKITFKGNKNYKSSGKKVSIKIK